MLQKLVKAVTNPRRAVVYANIQAYNLVANLKPKKKFPPSGLKELDEVNKRSLKRTDIADHLPLIFTETFQAQPKLVVELGVGFGESTFVFERATKLSKATWVSVDVVDRRKYCKAKHWNFVLKDDIAFAKEFKQWCKKKKVKPVIDVLFIDTSHLYEHTVQEIKAWFPYLAKKGKVLFHDTNLRETYTRKDGSMDFAYDNKREVMRAIEDYFKKSFNEKEDFVDFVDGWLIRHYANCNGLTILDRIGNVKKE